MDNVGRLEKVHRRERTLLQAAVALACLVPLGAGLAGIVDGPVMTGSGGSVELDSHFRYLSGLLFAIGLAFASLVPRIEQAGGMFRLLAAIVFVGGLARLASVIAVGWPATPMALALVTELAVTPVLALWQGRVARQSG